MGSARHKDGSGCPLLTSSRARFSRGVRTRFVAVPSELNVNAENPQILGAALAAGLYPKLISLDASGGMKTIINQQAVAIVRSTPIEVYCTLLNVDVRSIRAR